MTYISWSSDFAPTQYFIDLHHTGVLVQYDTMGNFIILIGHNDLYFMDQ